MMFKILSRILNCINVDLCKTSAIVILKIRDFNKDYQQDGQDMQDKKKWYYYVNSLKSRHKIKKKLDMQDTLDILDEELLFLHQVYQAYPAYQVFCCWVSKIYAARPEEIYFRILTILTILLLIFF